MATGRQGKGSIYVFAAGGGGTFDDCNADGYANSVYTMAINSVGENGQRVAYVLHMCVCVCVCVCCIMRIWRGHKGKKEQFCV